VVRTWEEKYYCSSGKVHWFEEICHPTLCLDQRNDAVRNALQYAAKEEETSVRRSSRKNKNLVSTYKTRFRVELLSL
jgi:hypothetical protein